MNNNIIKHDVDFGGQMLTLETGFLARQATSSVLATVGETTVLAAVVVGKETKSNYFPLQVVYEERLYASGKIKGSRFIKREGRPSDNAVLTGRMVDRSIRSLFDPYIRNEIQVIITVLSLDEVNSPDTLAVLAASTALSICNIDGFSGMVSSIRIAKEGAKLIPNPSYEQVAKSEYDVVVSGDGENIMMLEAGAKEVNENDFGDALDKSANILAQLNEFQAGFVKAVDNQEKPQIVNIRPGEEFVKFWDQYQSVFQENIYSNDRNKKEKEGFIKNSIDSVQTGIEVIKSIFNGGQFSDTNSLLEWFNGQEKEIITVDETNGIAIEKKLALSIIKLYENNQDFDVISTNLEHGMEEFLDKLVKENILESELRVDGRKLDQVREIICKVGLFGRTHGSSIFQRGETQVLNVLTVGTKNDAQIMDNMEDFEESTKSYMHHYNFPAYSVGETGRYFGPGRREIGHGSLAEKALLPVLPDFEEFPYTLRLVSECLGSNGSTSMASTCASSLSLMDGGINITRPVAGIAMGLVVDNSDSKKFKVLTDIQGMEDHYGGMDFKITGTRNGITAVQLDNKITGVSLEALKTAINDAKKARIHILDIMEKAIAKPRAEMSKYAPMVESIVIPMDKVSEVIGSGGKIIKGIIAKTDTEIEIDDVTGRALIYGKKRDDAKQALEIIKKIIKEYKQGEKVQAQIFRLEAYGAFAKIDGGEKEGLIHISETGTEKGKKIEDIFVLGQTVEATVKSVNDKGQISLTIVDDSKKPNVSIHS